jgi:hypothetical protein
VPTLKFCEAFDGVIEWLSQRFVVFDEDAISRVAIFIAKRWIRENTSDAGSALVPNGNFSSAETIEMFHQGGFPYEREFLAWERDLAGEMIEQLKTRSSGGGGVVDEGTVNVEEDHGVELETRSEIIHPEVAPISAMALCAARL